MAIINRLNCFSYGANLGVGACLRNPKQISVVIFGRIGKIFNPTELLSAKTTFTSAATANNPADRIYYVPAFVAENQSADPGRYTYADQSTVITSDPVIRVQFEHKLGACLQNQLLNGFNGSQGQFGVMFVDTNGTLHAQSVKDADGNTTGVTFAPASEIYVAPYTLADPSNPSRFLFEVQLDSYRSLNQDVAYADLGFSFRAEIPQVQSVILTNVGWVSGTAGTVNIAAVTGCGGTSFVSQFPTALANPAAWVATNFATGATITITSVSVVQINGDSVLLVDFDQTDSDYPAAGGKIILNLASVSALGALGMQYFEAQPITLTRPA